MSIPLNSELPEHRCVISGLGRSRLGRRLGASALSLTLESAAAAVQDAGLRFEDIDGIATFPGAVKDYSPGFAGPDIWDVHDALGLRVNWSMTTFQGPSQIGAVIGAMLAVSAGLCRHALVYRTVTEATGQGIGPRRAQQSDQGEIAPPYDWLFAVGAVSPANWLAFYATRYMETYGATREQIGWLPVIQRRHAARNDYAVLREPYTIDDYLAARMISEPFCLLDCDIPIDGSTSFVVSAVETVPDLRKPVWIEAVATALHGRPYWEQWEDLTTSSMQGVARQLWSRTDLRPADLDVAHLYDGFSIIPILWLEALGICGRGEAAAFVEGGHRIDLAGQMPVNPHGGQLSQGRLHGFGVLAEAVTQLRHEAGPRQVADAEVTVAAVGGGGMGGAALLTRDRR